MCNVTCADTQNYLIGPIAHFLNCGHYCIAKNCTLSKTYRMLAPYDGRAFSVPLSVQSYSYLKISLPPKCARLSKHPSNVCLTQVLYLAYISWCQTWPTIVVAIFTNVPIMIRITHTKHSWKKIGILPFMAKVAKQADQKKVKELT